MPTVEQDEREVEEVLCSECGAPMPSIPAWYANVKVKFTCDNCRQRSSRPAPLPTLAPAAPRAALADDPDVEVALDDAEIDAVDEEETDIVEAEEE